MEYDVVCNLQILNQIIQEDDNRQYKLFMEEFKTIPSFQYHIFRDCDIHEIEYKDEFYTQQLIYNWTNGLLLAPSGNSWEFIGNQIKYKDAPPGMIDAYPLSSLDYILEHFFFKRNLMVNGRVVLFNKNTSFDKYKVLVYDVKDCTLIYNPNKTTDYTTHWKNCHMFANRERIDVSSIYYVDLYQQRIFTNFMSSNYNNNEDEITPRRLFISTYHRDIF